MIDAERQNRKFIYALVQEVCYIFS